MPYVCGVQGVAAGMVPKLHDSAGELEVCTPGHLSFLVALVSAEFTDHKACLLAFSHDLMSFCVPVVGRWGLLFSTIALPCCIYTLKRPACALS